MGRHDVSGIGRGTRRRGVGRRTAALATAAIGIALAVGTLPALAGPTVGNPQPELVKFPVGAIGGAGSGAILASNNVVLASPSSSGTAINVCVLTPAARSCVRHVTLQALRSGGNPQDTFSGPIGVYETGPATVAIVAEDCCYAYSGAIVFLSTDGGTSFAAPRKAGNIDIVGASTFVAGTLVVATSMSLSDGTRVQAFSPTGSVPADELRAAERL